MIPKQLELPLKEKDYRKETQHLGVILRDLRYHFEGSCELYDDDMLAQLTARWLVNKDLVKIEKFSNLNFK